MPGTPNALPSTTLAVLRPTPGSVTSSSSVFGTLPPNRSTSAADSPMTDFVLALKKPVGFRISATSSGFAAARSSGVGYLANSAGVVMFTRLSVVWAESTVDTSSWNASWKSSSQCASGYVSASTRLIFLARRTSAVCVSGVLTAISLDYGRRNASRTAIRACDNGAGFTTLGRARAVSSNCPRRRPRRSRRRPDSRSSPPPRTPPPRPDCRSRARTRSWPTPRTVTSSSARARHHGRTHRGHQPQRRPGHHDRGGGAGTWPCRRTTRRSTPLSGTTVIGYSTTTLKETASYPLPGTGFSLALQGSNLWVGYQDSGLGEVGRIDLATGTASWNVLPGDLG